MEDNQIPEQAVSEWQPTTSKVDLAYLGKLGEELSECATAVFRCIIQGINESEPTTGKLNREWLEDELADVQSLFRHVIPHFNLDVNRIARRAARKYEFKGKWFTSLKDQESAEVDYAVLLRKYMENVYEQEGLTFTKGLPVTAHGERKHGRVAFTADEVSELQGMNQHIDRDP